MTKGEMRDIVVKALTEVAPEIDPATIDPKTSLTEQLDLDSMDLLNVIVAIGEQTGIDVPERDYGRLSTLDGAVAYLEAAVAGG